MNLWETDSGSLDSFGIQCVIETSKMTESLRLSWRNCRVSMDYFLVFISLFIWAGFSAATIYMTVMLLMSNVGGQASTAIGICFQWIGMILWLLVGWTVTIGFPYYYRSFFCQEWIEISSQSVTLGLIGPWWSETKQFPLNEIDELVIEYHGEESVLTLSIWFISSCPRKTTAYWLAPKLKARVFGVIKEFVLKNKIPLRMRAQY